MKKHQTDKQRSEGAVVDAEGHDSLASQNVWLNKRQANNR